MPDHIAEEVTGKKAVDRGGRATGRERFWMRNADNTRVRNGAILSRRGEKEDGALCIS